MRFTLGIALLVSFLASMTLCGCGTGTQADAGAIVAQVGDATLTVRDFKVLRQSALSSLKLGQARPTDEQLLDKWISWQVVIAKAKQMGLDKDAGLRFKVLEAQARVYGGELHSRLIESEMAIPTDADIKAFYDSHLKDYTAKSTILWLSMFSVKDEAKAREAAAKLQAGEDFEAVAKTYAENYDEKRGTNIGYRELKSFPEEQQKILEKLVVGKISEPIPRTVPGQKAPQNYMIVKLLDREEPGSPMKFEGIDPNQLRSRLGMEQMSQLEQKEEQSMFAEFKITKYPERIPEPEPGEISEAPKAANK
jgi:parvulin-like peptidyl-prolyl isomerase